jgi:protein arginine N-methyltransferase 7
LLQIPKRLQGKSEALITAANDFHYAMMNDHDRNDFYLKALAKVVDANSLVLEIGTGSGLLAMIAARQNPKGVVAVEANHDMCAVARKNMRANNLEDKISIVNKLSTEVLLQDFPEDERPNVLVSEILGTLLLGESALDYVSDVRERLLAPDAVIIPAGGCQFVTLIESADLQAITSVKGWGGYDLEGFNSLQDTVSLVFTKQFGFRFSSIKHRVLAPRVVVADVDFYKDSPGYLPQERVSATLCAPTYCLMHCSC